MLSLTGLVYETKVSEKRSAHEASDARLAGLRKRNAILIFKKLLDKIEGLR